MDVSENAGPEYAKTWQTAKQSIGTGTKCDCNDSCRRSLSGIAEGYPTGTLQHPQAVALQGEQSEGGGYAHVR